MLLLEPPDHLLGVKDRGMQLLRGVVPNPVQVHPRKAAPVVAVDHAIRIEHGNDLEKDSVAQLLAVVDQAARLRLRQ